MMSSEHEEPLSGVMTVSDRRRRRRLSSLMLSLGLLVLLGGAVQMLHGATSTGYSVDEQTHVERLQNWHNHGWYLPNRDLDPDNLPGSRTASRAVYGPAFGWLAHLANVALGHETYGQVETTAAANDVRHLTVAVLGIVTVGAVGLIAWLLSRSLLATVWAMAALSSIPVWVGHAMFNIKDVPTAAGYTLATLALVTAMTSTVTGRDRWPVTVAAGATLAVGIAIGVGTRTGSWILIALSVVTYVSIRAFASWATGRWRVARSDVALIVGGLAGLSLVFALYPNNAARPHAWFLAAVRGSAEFPWTGFTLTAGRLLDENPVWWYLPAWLGASLPFAVSAAAISGVVVIVHALSRTVRRADNGVLRSLATEPHLVGVLIVQQLLLGPLAAIALGTVLYSGLRQQLFIVPPIAVLAGLGVAGLARWFAGQPRWRAVLGTAVICVVLLVPTVDQLRLHPYQYVYVNSFAAPINNRWEADYWFVGAREAVQRVPPDERAFCSGWLVRPWNPERDPGLFGGCGRSIGPYLEEQGVGPLEVDLGEDEAWVIGRVRGGNRPPDQCREIGNVTRTLRAEEVLITYLLACVREPSD